MHASADPVPCFQNGNVQPRGREHDLATAIRGGGHSGPGLGLVNDGLVIDLSCMKGIRADVLKAGVDVPPLFVEQMAHVVLRNILEGSDDPLRLRAAELFFREQKATAQDGHVLLADLETVEMHASGSRYGSLGRLIVEAQGATAAANLDVLDRQNAALYWERESRHDTVVSLTFGRPVLDAFCRVMEAISSRAEEVSSPEAACWEEAAAIVAQWRALVGDGGIVVQFDAMAVQFVQRDGGGAKRARGVRIVAQGVPIGLVGAFQTPLEFSLEGLVLDPHTANVFVEIGQLASGCAAVSQEMGRSVQMTGVRGS